MGGDGRRGIQEVMFLIDEKKVIENSFLVNLEEEIDLSKFLRDLQKNKFIFGCSSAIMFIFLSFFFFSTRKWVGAIDVVINTKYSIKFGLMNFSDTRVRADFTEIIKTRKHQKI